MTWEPTPSPRSARPCHHVSTGSPLYSPVRKFITVSGLVGRNQTTCPSPSRISAPRWPAPDEGERNRQRSDAPPLTIVSRGGRRSGRERKRSTSFGERGVAACASSAESNPSASNPSPPSSPRPRAPPVARLRNSARVAVSSSRRGLMSVSSTIGRSLWKRRPAIKSQIGDPSPVPALRASAAACACRSGSPACREPRRSPPRPPGAPVSCSTPRASFGPAA